MDPILSSYIKAIKQHGNEAYLMIRNVNDVVWHQAVSIILEEQAARTEQKDKKQN